jgi:hypothetical protein
MMLTLFSQCLHPAINFEDILSALTVARWALFDEFFEFLGRDQDAPANFDCAKLPFLDQIVNANCAQGPSFTKCPQIWRNLKHSLKFSAQRSFQRTNESVGGAYIPLTGIPARDNSATSMSTRDCRGLEDHKSIFVVVHY